MANIENNKAALIDPEVAYPSPLQDFKTYIDECRDLIQHYRLDLNSDWIPEKVIEANSPFEIQSTSHQSRIGILLTHGLLDSPLMMRDLGNILGKQGYHVRALLLPGHGTRPGALLHIQYEDWMKTFSEAIANFSKEVDQIFLLGYSTGASLGLLHVLQDAHPQIRGLIQLAPALKIASRLDFIQKWPPYLGRYWDIFNWFYTDTENDYAKYQSLPFNAGYQVYRLAKAIWFENAKKKIDLPLFSVLSEKDKTVSSQAGLAFLNRQTNEDNETMLYTDDASPNPKMITRPSAYPEWHIEALSHIAIPISTLNPHYGIEGDYVEASRLKENLKSPHPYSYGSDICISKGFSFGLKSETGQYRRLTCNPDFDFMAENILQFITKHASR